MSDDFGVQYSALFGSYGEFSVPAGALSIRARFLLTKMRPGIEGTWENALASQMTPWREVFNVEQLTFDELLQRDLDDSRVAHDLIPYLLGERGNFARFFPPILAVLVPRDTTKAGISKYYPEPTDEDANRFDRLFSFEPVKIDDRVSPLARLRYNSQRTAFVIVDGQHRAMAVLALHRQLNDSWGQSSYASYYAHIEPAAEEIKDIELPVCIVYFPEMHEGSAALKERGIDLGVVCRELFLVVNRTAKRVSHSRELLLDDEDFAARMMRRSLSALKGRSDAHAGVARVYSFAFGDSSSDTGRAVVTDRLEYSSAIALYRIHAAAIFGSPSGYELKDPDDISDLRRCKNTDRPARILIGTPLEHWEAVSRLSAKRFPIQETDTAVNLLGSLTDKALLHLFDAYAPFEVQNRSLRELRTRLAEPDSRSDPIQSKCYTLLFEGSGVRGVFQDHYDRLVALQEDHVGRGESAGDHVEQQIGFAQSVLRALNRHEGWLEARSAAKLFNLDYDSVLGDESDDEERREIIIHGRKIFTTVATQAFQLGFVMAAVALSEKILEDRPDVKYDERLKTTDRLTRSLIAGLNAYLSDPAKRPRKERAGLLDESRSRVFDSASFGLRGLLYLSTKELNERQWLFFQYAVLEIVHSHYGLQAFAEEMRTADRPLAERYSEIAPAVTEAIHHRREAYVVKAEQAAVSASDFQRELDVQRGLLRGEKKTEKQIEEAIETRTEEVRSSARDLARQHLKASLGQLDSNHAKALERIRSVFEAELTFD